MLVHERDNDVSVSNKLSPYSNQVVYELHKKHFISSETNDVSQCVDLPGMWASEYCFTSLSAQSRQYLHSKKPNVGIMPYFLSNDFKGSL